MTRDNVTYLRPRSEFRDYPDPFLTDIYAGPAEQERLARVVADVRRDIRVSRWQLAIKLFCIVTAVLSFGYIVGREIWAVLS